MKSLSWLPSVCLALFLAAHLKAQSRPLDFDAVESWNRVTETVLSPDGRWIAYTTEPWHGDSKVFLHGSDGQKRFEHDRGSGVRFTDDSRFLLFTVKPKSDRVRKRELPKAAKDPMPTAALAIHAIDSGQLESIPNVRDFKLPDAGPPWLAYRLEARPDRERSDDPDRKNSKTKSPRSGFALRLRNLDDNATPTRSWPFATGYWFSQNGKRLFFASTGDQNDFQAGVYRFDLEENRLRPILLGAGDCRQVAVAPGGDKVAFLWKSGDAGASGDFGLYLWTGKGRARRVLDNRAAGMTQAWRVSEHGRVWFSANGRRVFLGTAPVRPPRDAGIPDDEFPDVDVWHGGEETLHSEQLVQLPRDPTRTYLAMYDLDDARFAQIETADAPRSTVLDRGNADLALVHSSKPYELESMWDPLRHDAYLLDLATGRRTLVAKGLRDPAAASPGGQYLIWFDYSDRSYHAHHIASGTTRRITEPSAIRADDESNTTFDYSAPYGSPGWLRGDRAVLIHDRHDVWKVDPENRRPPENLTQNGRKNRIVYRLLRWDARRDALDPEQPHLLMGVHETSRQSGYYRCGLKAAAPPQRLLGGKYRLSTPLKADRADTVVYTKETFQTFPDLWASDLAFHKSVRLSDANPQQADYRWGTAELYRWTSLGGQKLEGILYKPDDFDPAQKYPMIVQFFHKSSDQLHDYRIPSFHGSRIDYHYFVSNGYVVFAPDIHFDAGYIGQSAYKSIMPGVTALVDEGFIDPKRIGVQGHSYSGYQAAYLATRTGMFACIEAGAPVVNFFSAYGAIRWESGRARVAQYEHDQTRASLWEAPLRFLENSPLFALDKVTTPILIMHNDRDGAVPWSQGIEFFIALRRLQKPVWMLTYNGEGHSLAKLKNRRDFQIRLAQFFGHYLKDQPMPPWMRQGVPAVEKHHNLGYDLPPNPQSLIPNP
ncbi:MAG: S9 family peptidase [Pirellulales bacterium]|nr:S9 family peptidase [Pirellulales bacterium]